MRRKNIFLYLFFLLICFNGCDLKYPVKLNDKKVYKLICNNNQIEIRATGLMATYYQIKIKPTKDNIDFYTNGLEVHTNPSTEINVQFEYENDFFTGNKVIEKNKTLVCSFSLNIPFGSYYSHPKEIIIPPGNFILCNGKPLVTDTIRITLKK